MSDSERDSFLTLLLSSTLQVLLLRLSELLGLGLLLLLVLGYIACGRNS
jgi:hypothetical protein